MCIVAKVNGELYDLDRPLEVDSSVELLKFEDDEAKVIELMSFVAATFLQKPYLSACVHSFF